MSGREVLKSTDAFKGSMDMSGREVPKSTDTSKGSIDMSGRRELHDWIKRTIMEGTKQIRKDSD